jgi:hypothetical protein
MITLQETKEALKQLDEVIFQLPNGKIVPRHVHITEVGQITKSFIDCGGTVREEKKVNFQLWFDNDLEHRLTATKLLRIIELSEEVLDLENATIEVEYQEETIGKYSMKFTGTHFMLVNTQTDCLAKDKCGIPEKETETLSQSCAPGSGCC